MRTANHIGPLLYAHLITAIVILSGCAHRPLFESSVPAGDNAFECAVDEARSRGWSFVETATAPQNQRGVAIQDRSDSIAREKLVVIVSGSSAPRQLTIRLTGTPFAASGGPSAGPVPGTISVGDHSVTVSQASEASPQATQDAQAILTLCSV